MYRYYCNVIYKICGKVIFYYKKKTIKVDLSYSFSKNTYCFCAGKKAGTEE